MKLKVHFDFFIKYMEEMQNEVPFLGAFTMPGY